MDIILFVTVLSWAALIIGALGACHSLYLWYYYEYTTEGKLEQQLMAIQGVRIKGYFFTRRLLLFIVALAAIISLR